MTALKEKAWTLLGSLSSVNMQAVASTTIFTVPVGKTCRIMAVVIRDPSATLAGGTSYSITNFVQTFSLVNLTSTTGYVIVLPSVTSPYPMFTEIAGGTAVQLTVTTGSTGAATATVEIFGYLT